MVRREKFIFVTNGETIFALEEAHTFILTYDSLYMSDINRIYDKVSIPNIFVRKTK